MSRGIGIELHDDVAVIGGGAMRLAYRADGLVHQDVPYRLLAPRHAKVFADMDPSSVGR